MGIIIKTEDQIDGIRKSCHLASDTLDHIEQFIPPKKGRGHVWNIIRSVLTHRGSGKATETYGLAIDPTVKGNLSLIGVRNGGGMLGAYSIAPAGSTGNVVILDLPVDSPQLRMLRGQLNVSGALGRGTRAECADVGEAHLQSGR